jgi:hypothetical protein
VLSSHDALSSLSFLPPSYFLIPTGRGIIYPVILDVEKLSSLVPTSHCSAPFFLRRSSARAHDIAINKFAAILQVKSARKRKQWIEAVADLYAFHPTASMWDWKATMPLIFKCALLPQGSEFRHHHIDTFSQFNSSSVSTTSALYQKEILEKLLLPKAKEAIAASDTFTLRRIVDVAVELLGALDRRGCTPCPALECLIVSILWRLGFSNEVTAMLVSRASTTCMDQKSRHSGIILLQNQRVVDLGVSILVEMLVALTTEVELGINGSVPVRTLSSEREFVPCWKLWSTSLHYSHVRSYYDYATVSRLKHNLLRECKVMLSSRCSQPSGLIKHLLSQGRVLDAMSICSALSSSTFDAVGDPNFSLAKREITGEIFFRAAICKSYELGNPIERRRFFHKLDLFLSVWDPNCISTSFRKEIKRQTSFDADDIRKYHSRIEAASRNIQRRPSSQSLLMTSKSHAEDGFIGGETIQQTLSIETTRS